MPGFQIVRPQEISAPKFFDQLPPGVHYGDGKDKVPQPPFGIHLMERPGDRPVAARQGRRSAGVWRAAGVEMGG